jgi:hypothetical protein
LTEGKCDQIGRHFAVWAHFLKYCPNDLGAFFQNIRPKFAYIRSSFWQFLSSNSQISINNFLGQKLLFCKDPFWAIFGQNWALFFSKRITLKKVDFHSH